MGCSLCADTYPWAGCGHTGENPQCFVAKLFPDVYGSDVPDVDIEEGIVDPNNGVRPAVRAGP